MTDTSLLWGNAEVDELVAILAHHNGVRSDCIRSVAVLLYNYGVRALSAKLITALELDFPSNTKVENAVNG